MATLESRLDALEKALFTRDQSQGEDWEANCKALEAKNKDLQAKNDALQKAIERYELNLQSEHSITVLTEASDNDYKSALARMDMSRRDFVNLKRRLDDSEALEIHFRQKFQQQEEADLLVTAELNRAKRDLRLSEEKQAVLEQQWLEALQEKSKMEQKLQKLQLEVDSLARNRDEISSQLDASVKESKMLSAKLERAEALLHVRGENPPTTSNSLPESRGGLRSGEFHATRKNMPVAGSNQQFTRPQLPVRAVSTVAVKHVTAHRSNSGPLPPLPPYNLQSGVDGCDRVAARGRGPEPEDKQLRQRTFSNNSRLTNPGTVHTTVRMGSQANDEQSTARDTDVTMANTLTNNGAYSDARQQQPYAGWWTTTEPQG